MYGGFLTPPVNEESDLGVVFIHGTGMSTMCGHGAIVMGRAACELGDPDLKRRYEYCDIGCTIGQCAACSTGRGR